MHQEEVMPSIGQPVALTVHSSVVRFGTTSMALIQRDGKSTPLPTSVAAKSTQWRPLHRPSEFDRCPDRVLERVIRLNVLGWWPGTFALRVKDKECSVLKNFTGNGPRYDRPVAQPPAGNCRLYNGHRG